MLNAQSVIIKTEMDTFAQTLQTSLCFINIPEGVSLRWQQRLLPQVKLMSYDSVSTLSDTSDGIFTVIWPHFSKADTFVYTFTVLFTDSLPTVFSWGEGALLYVDSVKGIRKIKTKAQNIDRQSKEEKPTKTFSKYAYYIQVGSGSNHDRKRDYRLHRGDEIYVEKSGRLYRYIVGPFETEKQARERLGFYRKQVSDAFIVKDKRK
jgi:hypothetical protein